MRRRRRVLIAAFGGGALIAACNDRTTGSAEAPHTEGEYAWDNDPFQWAATDYAAAESLAGNSAPLPVDHALTRRVQYWADR